MFWQRTEPDGVIYTPQGEDDRTNQQVNAVLTPSGTFVAAWTMASHESRPDQRQVVARSTDGGKTWSEPIVIDAQEDGNGHQAGYGVPVLVPDTGRIYLYYGKNLGQIQVRGDVTGVTRVVYSDDDGRTWTPCGTIDMGRTEFSHPDPDAHPNVIGIYSPIALRSGRMIAGFGRFRAGPHLDRNLPVEEWSMEVGFIRFENILTEPDPTKLETTILPRGPRGVRVGDNPEKDWCLEPDLIELSDGRLFCVLRTRTGMGWFTVSADEGETWSDPAPLRYANGGEPILNPNAPMIVHRRADGVIVLLHYINKSEEGLWGLRDPLYLAIGRETLDQAQPIEFGPSRVLMTVDQTAPPEGVTHASVGSYSSLHEHEGRLRFFYIDSKCYVLMKDVTDRVQEAVEADASAS